METKTERIDLWTWGEAEIYGESNVDTYITIFKQMLLLLSHFSCVGLCATPWTSAYQASLSMGFSRQGYLSGLTFPSPGDFPDLRIEPRSPALQADTLTSEPPGSPKNIHISPPFWNYLPSSSPSHPSRLIQSSCLSFLRHTANSH